MAKQVAVAERGEVKGRKLKLGDIKKRFEELERNHREDIKAGKPLMLHPCVIEEALILLRMMAAAGIKGEDEIPAGLGGDEDDLEA